jgi:hypothetical protein
MNRPSDAARDRRCSARWPTAVLALVLAGVTGLAGCAGLLPTVRTDQRGGFGSYDAARDALARVVPYRTTRDDLKAIGFDVETSANIRLVGYPQVVALLMPNPNLSPEQLDPGIRDCVAARHACRAYVFELGRTLRERRPPVLLDLLNFRRVTQVTGWRFEGLIVMRDGVVLFASHGGEPRIERTERRSNPLGPFQSGSDMVGSSLRLDNVVGSALVR